jgi:hypothetical protein
MFEGGEKSKERERERTKSYPGRRTAAYACQQTIRHEEYQERRSKRRVLQVRTIALLCPQHTSAGVAVYSFLILFLGVR